MPRRLRLAILTNDDAVWALPAWRATVPRLARSHDLAGIWTFPPRLGPHTGWRGPAWYLRTMGPGCFLIFSALALGRSLAAWGRGWAALARSCGAEWRQARNPQEPAIAAWLREKQVDVVFITLDYILKPELLEAARLGFINKHAALLPGCRGLMAPLWARLAGQPTGYSFHRVEAGIDTGPLLHQELYPPETDPAPRSLLRLYLEIFARFPAGAEAALDALITDRHVAPLRALADQYHGLPTAADVAAYRARGFRLARWSDLVNLPPPS